MEEGHLCRDPDDEKEPAIGRPVAELQAAGAEA